MIKNRITPKPHARLQLMTKALAKSQKDRYKLQEELRLQATHFIVSTDRRPLGRTNEPILTVLFD